ncbi:hypothetical protein ACA910_006441 [Epithemia clementina (nom. ined.)]
MTNGVGTKTTIAKWFMLVAILFQHSAVVVFAQRCEIASIADGAHPSICPPEIKEEVLVQLDKVTQCVLRRRNRRSLLRGEIEEFQDDSESLMLDQSIPNHRELQFPCRTCGPGGSGGWWCNGHCRRRATEEQAQGENEDDQGEDDQGSANDIQTPIHVCPKSYDWAAHGFHIENNQQCLPKTGVSGKVKVCLKQTAITVVSNECNF